MSLEQVDQLIGILYNERIKEQREEIERLTAIQQKKIFVIYHTHQLGIYWRIVETIVCSIADLKIAIKAAIIKLLNTMDFDINFLDECGRFDVKVDGSICSYKYEECKND